MANHFLYFCLLTLFLFSCKPKVTQTFHENGKVMEEFTVNKNGEKEGVYTSYYDDGIIYEKAEYINGKLTGKRILHYPNGKPEIIENYNSKGELHGLYQTFYKNGQLMTEKNYVHNVLEGTVTVYFENGNLRETVFFKDNQENGNFVEYFQNGKIQWKGTYLNGPNEFGELEEYDSTGIIIKKMICDSMAICRSTWKIDQYDEKYNK